MSKTYLPNEDINSNFHYSISEHNILVRTNRNCYTQYSTTYCDCYYIYPINDYIKSEISACNYNSGTWVNSNQFTSDYWYRLDIASVLIIFTIIFLFGIYMPYKILSRLFGRWLKV